MSLFADDTVIIVGAGASVPFGLPTGAEMIDLIIEEFKREANVLVGIARNKPIQQSLASKAPFSYALGLEGPQSKQLDPNFGSQKMEEIAAWLTQQTGDSIDDIIRHNPSRAEALKVGICKVLFDKTFRQNERRSEYIPLPFEDRFYGLDSNASGDNANETKVSAKKNRNWIHHLINLARGQLWTMKQNGFLPSSKIKIISFNYDGILEHVLNKKWKNIETEFGDWEDYIEIAHPHGSIDIKDFVDNQGLAAYLIENAQKIGVVHEGVLESPNEVTENRLQARYFCTGAKNVYAIGFAFARANVELLGLDSKFERKGSLVSLCDDGKMSKGLIHYINYDDSFGLRSRVREVCNRASSANSTATVREMGPKEMTAGPGRKLEISEAIIAGFLGEMPA